jgi:hypothetical protein
MLFQGNDLVDSMDSASHTTHDLAMLLLDCERMEKYNRAELTDDVQMSFEKLRINLSRRLGSEGYHALLSRSVALSTSRYPWVGLISIEKDGTLAGFVQGAELESLSSIVNGSVEIMACIIGLLDAFVGRELSMRLLSNLSPKPIVVDEMGTKEDRNG